MSVMGETGTLLRCVMVSSQKGTCISTKSYLLHVPEPLRKCVRLFLPKDDRRVFLLRVQHFRLHVLDDHVRDERDELLLRVRLCCDALRLAYDAPQPCDDALRLSYDAPLRDDS